MSDEDRLEIPESWHRYLDGRPGGRMSAARVREVLDDPYAAVGRMDYAAILRDMIAAPYACVAEEGAGALQLIDTDPFYGNAEVAAAIAEAISVIPTDEAFEVLLDGAFRQLDGLAHLDRHYSAALTSASRRFPRRAIRLLAPRALAKGGERYRGLLERIVREAPQSARAVREALEPGARALVDAILDASEVERASSDQLPAVLRDPPWLRGDKPPKKKKPKKLAIDPLPVREGMVWRQEERAKWAASAPRGRLAHVRPSNDEEWRALRDPYMAHSGALYCLVAPEHIARAAVRALRPTKPRARMQAPYMRALVARLELDAQDAALAFAQASPKDGGELLLPFGTLVAADHIASVAKKREELALRWLARHAELAALAFIPRALAGDSAAAHALSLLARSHRDTLDRVAARYGEEAAGALAPLLTVSELDGLPRTLPALPAFWSPAALPAPILRAGGALPNDALTRLATMLAFTKPGAPYAGIVQVKEACTPESIARFSWALFEAWLGVGAPADQKWAFVQLAWLGDDDIAYRLAKLMEDWPRLGAAKRAELGLEVLAEMKSDVALLLVARMAEKARSKSLRKHAQEKMARLADRLSLSEDELADRLVPTLDLDRDGALELDYGSRRFAIAFDETLRPFVVGAGKSLPKPGKDDDPALAAAAQQRFKLLKKNARTIASSQTRRLERAMVGGRRWKGADFTRFVVEHPLLFHIARRLVWGAYEEDALIETFRIADDRTLETSQGERFVLGAREVAIVHPLVLGPEGVERWAEVLRDRRILQPFQQLERDVHPGDDRAAQIAELLEDQVPAGALAGLAGRGWERGPTADHGIFDTMRRAFGAAITVELEFEPGIANVAQDGSQELSELRVLSGSGEASIDALDPVAFSELVRDLSALS